MYGHMLYTVRHTALGKKAATHSGNYQDNITMPLLHEYDNDAMINDNIDENEAELDNVLPTIERVSNTKYNTMRQQQSIKLCSQFV